jgi:hypothetical protein
MITTFLTDKDDVVRYDAQSLTEEQKAQAIANIGAVAKNDITLGVYTDGLLYIFVNGVPAGHGIELTSGGISGYIAEDGTIVLTNLNDGEYTIAYEMNNGTLVTIGKPVVDNNVYYSVTKTLTQCNISNSATQVTEGSSYSATISANKNYEITSITVTMGGTDISSSAVSGGKITISNVTGNLVITAVAVEAGPAYTNQIPLSKDENGNPYNGGQGWKTGYRLSGSSGAESAQTGTEVTGFIPFKYSDTIRLKNIKDSDNSRVIGIYDSSHTKVYTVSYSALFASSSLTMDGRLIELKIGVGNFVNAALTSSNVAYLRVSATEITNDSIITINEEIV